MQPRDIALAAVFGVATATAASAAHLHAYFDFVVHAGLQDTGERPEFSAGDLTDSATGHVMNEDGSIGDIRQIGQYGTETFFDFSTWRHGCSAPSHAI